MGSVTSQVTRKALMTLVVAFMMSGFTTNAHAWGAKGHQIVSFVGSQLAAQDNQPFWASNADSMRTLSTVPDRVWKAPATKDSEAPTHWFQADAYVKNLNQCDDILAFPKQYDDAVSAYGESVLIKNGTAPYRIVQMYRLALAAFRSGDLTAAVEETGAMSHYVGDLSQPLHVSENYDGKETGNDGIHAWFETTNIGDEMSIRRDVMIRAQALLKNSDFLADMSGDLADVVNHEIIRSLKKRDEILQNDSKLGRSSPTAKQTQLELAEDRMADGAATLAIIMDRLSVEADLSQTMSAVPIEDPKWIEPSFGSNFRAQSFNTPIYPDKSELDDDCGAI